MVESRRTKWVSSQGTKLELTNFLENIPNMLFILLLC